MKKILLTVMIAVMAIAVLFGFAACGDKQVFVGVQSGNTAKFYVDGDEEWEFDGFKNLKAKEYDSASLAIMDMKNGGINYVMTDIAPAKKLVQSIKDVKVIDIPLTDEDYAFGVDKANNKLLADVNEILTEMQASGKLDEIAGNYFSDTYKPEGVTSATKDLSKSDTQLVIATNSEFPPFESKDGEKFIGIDIEIVSYIAKELGMELVIEDMDFDAVVTAVGKNGIDMAVSGLTVSEARKESVNFTKSYYKASQVLIVKESNTTFDACKTADDVVAVLKGLKK